MRDNMLFFGVPESQSPVYAGVGSASADDQATSMDASSSAPVGQPIPSTMCKPLDMSSTSFADVTKQGENWADLVYEFCEALLKIETPKSKIQIERAHRIGVRKPDKIRPIVAKFVLSELVSPNMNYGGEVWGFHNSQDIERVHLRFLKQLLNVRQQTSNMTIYGELCRVPFYVIRKIRIVKYWFKILANPFTLLYKVYKQQAIDVDNNRNLKSWSANVKTFK